MNKKLIGFMIIVFSLLSMGIWEFWGREYFSYQDILVLKESLDSNTVVTEESFEIKRVDSPSKEALRPTDKNQLIGKETSQFVAGNAELRKEYFISAEYQIGGDTGKGIMAISTDWLLSYPQTLMRGDKVTIFKGDDKIGECIIAHVRDSSNNEVTFSQKDRFNSSGIVIYVEVIGDVRTLMDISKVASKGQKLALINVQ